ncbi:hypothetical protein, partial [Aeromonas caviae]
TWPEGGNINMMHGDSRVMVVVCLETASLPAPCLSTSTSPRSREEPLFIHLTLLTHMQTTECTFRPKSQSFATSNDCASSKSIQSLPKE